VSRKLAAILAADVVGYSRLMEQDEKGTLDALKRHRSDVLDPAVAAHNGRTVKLMGDGVLVEFASVVDAVECAVSVQLAGTSAEENALRLRIGINLGDVVIDGDDIYGEGVNVAARLEALAEPGGICISGVVYESLGKKIDVNFNAAGEHSLKNIHRPVRVYHWHPDAPADGSPNTNPPLDKSPDRPSIAVLAFDNMSGDPEQEYFSDGIAEDIITSLSHFREFFVIARNTTFTYKGQSIRVNDVCRELGVRYLLEGSVRKAGQRVRVTAQLIEGETGAHLWASRFDRELDDIFAVQDEITQAIVSAVMPEALGAELRRTQLKQPENLNAWEKVIQARWHLHKLTKQNNEVALKLLTDAVDSAPMLAVAHSTLALCHLHGMLHIWRADASNEIQLAHDFALRAISLDENDAGALSILGMTALFARKFDEAANYLDRSVALNPNLANAHGVLAAYHGVSGDFDAAQAAADRALALSPRDPSKSFWLGGVGIGAFVAGRYDDCVTVSRGVLREHPGYASSMRQLTAALSMLGRDEEAAESLEQLLKRMPDLTVSQVRRIVPVREPEDWDRWLDALRKAGLPE